MIISISGVPGSGKTTVAKRLAEKCGMPFYSIGGLRGSMAIERGMTIAALNMLGETDKTTDTSVDEYQRNLGATKDDFVIEGRLSWHFIPHSFKIFLDCDPHVAAQRIFHARLHDAEGSDRLDEPLYANVEQAQQEIKKRMASDDLRYAKYYGVNYRDSSHYDLVVDTTNMVDAEATTDAILARLPPHEVQHLHTQTPAPST